MTSDPWSSRWRQLARAAGLDPRESLVLALSGGADSVFLLHVLAAAVERPHITVVHVDHGLRAAASDADARFCAGLCARLGVGFVLRHLELESAAPGLEARAREARYTALFEEARRLGERTILTGHHGDDALETLLLRWIRGTALGGLASLRPTLALGERPDACGRGRPRSPGQHLSPGRPLRVVRPLISMRREEVRRLLSDAGHAWCEDATNADPAFARNRVRHPPRLSELGGRATLANLRAFGNAVEELEGNLAGATAHLSWQPAAHAVASRSRAQSGLGGSIARAAVMRLPSALRRRALWRLLLEGTGRAPRRRLLEAVLADIESGRCATHALPCGFTLHVRAAELVCVPPAARLDLRAGPRQLRLSFGDASSRERQLTADDWSGEGAELAVPGEVRLPDGRVLAAELVRREPQERPPRARLEVELDAGRVPDTLRVRFPRAGDRLHPLGAPGSRALGRFLSDCGVPREERARVPLVLAGERIAWVAGVRPAQAFRVGPSSDLRLRLRLLNAAPEPLDEPDAPPASPASGVSQGELWAAAGC